MKTKIKTILCSTILLLSKNSICMFGPEVPPSDADLLRKEAAVAKKEFEAWNDPATWGIAYHRWLKLETQLAKLEKQS